MIKVYGVLCGRCVGCQWGAALNDNRYMTACSILATDIENTDNPADQCLAFVEDPTDEQKVW